MAEFDRKGAVLAALEDMTDQAINRQTELRITGARYGELIAEVRRAVRVAYEGHEDAGPPEASEILEEANIVPVDMGGLSVYFEAVEAAWLIDAGDVPYDPSEPVSEFIAAVLKVVYSNGIGALVEYLEQVADAMERDHIDDDEDEG